MDNKITIIEGPPPTFEAIGEDWVLGLNESPNLYSVAITRLRTFNGPALVERCYRAWKNRDNIYLEFRNSDGLEQNASILAARTVEMEDGQLLLLWVRTGSEGLEVESFSDDSEEDDPGSSDA
jgi:hypothetical protein